MLNELSWTQGDSKPQRPRALVVDDDVEVAEALSSFLSMTGTETTAVHSVEAAQRVLAGDPTITVVVTDLRMPGADGLELAASVRETTPESGAIEVVMITAYATNEVAFNAGRTNIFAFLQKPFRPQNLGQLVREAHVSATARRRAALNPRRYPVEPEPPMPEGGTAAIICSAVAASGTPRDRQVSISVDTVADVDADVDRLRAALAAVIGAAVAVATRGAVVAVSVRDNHDTVEFAVAAERVPYPAPAEPSLALAARLAKEARGHLEVNAEGGPEFRACIAVQARAGQGV